MIGPEAEVGRRELRAARAQGRALLALAALFSLFVNLLMMTGSLFMLQVYDRVLGSRSEETLVSLFLLVAFLFAVMGILDLARARLMTRFAARFQRALERRVFAAALRRKSVAPGDAAAAAATRDLEAVQRFFGSGVLIALFDAPAAPVFLSGIFLFHPALGCLALGGGLALFATAVLARSATRCAVAETAALSALADRLANQLHDECDLVQSMGMRGAGFTRWQDLRQRALLAGLAATDRSGAYAVLSKNLRQFLQSAMLALGAWLVLRDQVTAGAMVASSVLMGRALAPVEQAIGGWAAAQRAQEGWRRLADLLTSCPPEPARTALPSPRALLEVRQLSVVPPGRTAAGLRMLSFRLEPGKALGVIGPSGAGKSTLARALTGVWRPASGSIRLDGATLDQYDPDVLGRYVGYLPQRVALFDGTIAENIARLTPEFDDGAVVAAALRAGAHQMILSLPDGYGTRVSHTGGGLSGGQIQRIGLARALYGDPVLLVLDEPNSNLDTEGSLALNGAIRQVKAAGRSVLIMAHRPAAILECDDLLVLDGGTGRSFGPRDEVLRAMVRNAGQIGAPRQSLGAA